MTVLLEKTATPTELPLRRNWRFQALWTGSAFAMLGVEIADLAYPLVILALTGSAAMAGAFGAIQLTASLLAGLPAGALVDRRDRRHVLVAAESIRALVVASVAVAAYTDRLTIAHLLVAAGALGAVQPFAGAARMLLVRSVVPPAQLTAALTQDEVRIAAAGLAGPPLSGMLLAVGRAVPFLACAVSFVLSLVAALIVRVPPKPAAATPTAGQPAKGDTGGMLDGLRELWRHRAIRSALLMISLVNIGGTAYFLAVVVLLKHQGATDRTVGLTVSAVALGSLAGAALVGPLHRWFAPGKLLLMVTCSVALLVPPLLLPWGAWWIAVVLGVSTLGVPALRVLIDVLILRQVPDERRGRTMAALMTVITVGMPVGTFAGGYAVQYFGAARTLLGLTALYALTVLVGLADRQLREARWPAVG